jgi:hypothetical protein
MPDRYHNDETEAPAYDPTIMEMIESLIQRKAAL